MVRLIDDLLDVSRISRNKLNVRKERVEDAARTEQALPGKDPDQIRAPERKDHQHEQELPVPGDSFCDVEGDRERQENVGQRYRRRD